MRASSDGSPGARASVCALAAMVVGAAILLAPACTGQTPARYYPAGASSPCEGQLAKPIPASQCPEPKNSGLGPCSGRTAYALCNENTFSVCTCELPGDYYLDGGTVDSGSGPPIKGTVPLKDAGFENICCTGKTVFEIPASECQARCSGNVAYAICVDEAYTECACDIPDGYGFSDYVCPGDY